MPDTVLVLAGGTTPTPEVQRALPPAAMCIAADSGIDHARHLGLVPDLAVGDLDSVSADGLAWLRTTGAEVFEHPADKAQTDLELALDHAVATGARRVVVAAIGGGRVDHLLANFAVMASPRYAGTMIDGLVGTALVSVVHDRRKLSGLPSELVSLLPVHGGASGIVTSGLAYELQGETLAAGGSRGVSNYFIETTATVTLSAGILLAVQPDRLTSSPPEAPAAG